MIVGTLPLWFKVSHYGTVLLSGPDLKNYSVFYQEDLYSSIFCIDEGSSSWSNRTCLLENVCRKNGVYTIFVRELLDIPDPLVALNVNFWSEHRGSGAPLKPFTVVPQLGHVPRKSLNKWYTGFFYFLEELDFQNHFGHVFWDGMFSAYHAMRMFKPESERFLKFAAFKDQVIPNLSKSILLKQITGDVVRVALQLELRFLGLQRVQAKLEKGFSGYWTGSA